MKRRPLLTFVESQTREAPERRVCEAREYYITTRMQSGQTVSLLREAFRYWGRRKEIWADSEGVKVETENEGTFLASFLPIFSHPLSNSCHSPLSERLEVPNSPHF